MRPAALHRAQEHAAKWAAWIAVLGHAWAIFGSLWRPGAFGMPPWWVLVLALGPTLVLTLMIQRRIARSRHALVWYFGLLIPILIREPFVTERAALAIVCPVALATFLTGPRTVVAMGIVPICLVALRAPSSSPYLEPGYIGIYLVLVSILFATRTTLSLTLAEAAKSSALYIEERKLAEQRLAHEAHHDSATGLPNRRRLHDMLADGLEDAKRGIEQSVLFIDIDGFKVVNDSLGHDFGDRLITSVAERLGPALPEGSTVFRFGGDELVALVRASDELAGEIAAGLVDSMHRPFELGERDVFVTASIGIAALRADHDRPEAVLKDADLAMYRAKERGRNRCERFDEKMRHRAVRRHELEQALRCALDAGEFSLAYQPKVSTNDGRIVGFEALARWNSAKLGSIVPAEFVPLAEETGLIVPIGHWVLEHAGAQLHAWQKRSPRLGGLKMAVNLSGRQLLGQDDFAEQVKAVLEANEVLPWSLELEVTESVLMTNAAKAVERLEGLKKLGVKLAIDDFGTGYSSLSYLRRFPVDVLKIDRAFVTGLGTSKEDSAIVHLIITLAQALGLETVAEGVETHEQLLELRSLGCDQLQGFLISRPLSAEAATALLERSYGLPTDERSRTAAE